MAEHGPIRPGATLGVFGGGQLGRMFAAAATRLGYRVAVFAPEPDPPAAQVAHQHIQADYHDRERVKQFAQHCAAITLEFENVPASAVELAGEITTVRPGPETLAICQDRLRERTFLAQRRLPVASFRPVHDDGSAEAAVRAVGTPAVLKASRFGYDGRSQGLVHAAEEAAEVWASLSTDAALCEAFVGFETEISVLVARSGRGELATFGPIENRHRSHILDCSAVPASVSERVSERAVAIAAEVADGLNLEGVICVEMFVVPGDELLINELAPRPHNSGHLTIECCATSQFEQQVRALCGLPLGSFKMERPAAMVNLLGDLWHGGEPAWELALTQPEVSLHLYGKETPRPGRKMGHLTAVSRSVDGALREAHTTRQRLYESHDDSPPHPTAVGGRVTEDQHHQRGM